MPNRIVVVGSGFSGLIFAVNMLRCNKKVTVILCERGSQFGRGVAYATTNPRHFLNVRASNMSAFPDDPNHFVRWLGHASGDQKNEFVARNIFGSYLQNLLKTLIADDTDGERLLLVRGEVVAVERRGAILAAVLADGSSIDADHLVLATGNLPPQNIPGLDDNLLTAPSYVPNPWATDALTAICPSDSILLVGTGLTAADVLLGLDQRAHTGRIMALSRRGLKPRAHAETGPVLDPVPIPAKPSLSLLVRLVRAAVDERSDWRSAVDGLRPHVQRLWGEASDPERKRFLRHLRPFWDVHRHRVAPTVDECIAKMQSRGQLAFAAGKINSVRLAGKDVDVSWRSRGHIDVNTTRVAYVINCTGAAAGLQKSPLSLLSIMCRQGLAKPDFMHLGIEVDTQCRIVGVDGVSSDLMSAIGPVSRGAFWEIVAVPDIRVQARQLAERLAGSGIAPPV